MKTKPNIQVSNGNGKFIQRIAIGLVATLIFFTFPKFCSAQLGHHDHDHDHDHHHNHEENPSFKYTREANVKYDEHHSHQHDDHSHKSAHAPKDDWSIWIHSLGSTALISAAPFLILHFIPLDNTEQMQPRLKVLLAFASGGLLGDAFLHLIPHSTTPHHHGEDHGHGHSHGSGSGGHDHGQEMMVGLYVLAGIVAFLVVEKVVRLLRGESGGHGHSHGEPAKVEKAKDKKSDKTEKNDKKKKAKSKPEKVSSIQISGYLNLAADFAHNFTDGLAIGASYLAGSSIGIVTTITILLHEVPHEIGDFAILIKSGCSRRKAICLQLVTALGAVAGTIIALLGTSGQASPWVLPFTAGGFIYIATVSVLPELLEESTKLTQSLKEISALLSGVGLMVLIAKLE